MLRDQTTPQGETGFLSSVRWLAELCGVAGVTTPRPRLASQLLLDPSCADVIADYVVWWMRHPDKGSTFESRTAALQELPDPDYISTLRRLGYDGLIFHCGDDAAGHIFFQRSGSDLLPFSASVSQAYRGGKWWATFSLDFVAYAASVPGVARVSVGTGRVARLLLRLIRPHADQLGWRLQDDGWIDFNLGGDAERVAEDGSGGGADPSSAGV